MTDEPAFQINIHYGTVEMEQRLALLPDGAMTYESRRVERDESGCVERISAWESSGIRIYFR